MKIIFTYSNEHNVLKIFFCCFYQMQGNHVFEVPNGYKLKITSGNSEVLLKESNWSTYLLFSIFTSGFVEHLNLIEEKLMDLGSWFWSYKINGTHIQLELVEL
ncbi:hypothetical protein HYC85_013776 [Camellia sinensis]|uniref:UGP3-like C-terminal hexapeptide repeats domain-containing protein n=1 Tax=Camellia sinensis TaxID=4442 RepID=A0A7J7H4B2_CAMSI|nr:hypothetical protein HYC85_013776 [Camellia sinensis]